MNSKDEKLLREFVRKTFVAKMLNEEREKFLQEQKVRSWVRSLISEVQEETTNTVVFEAKDQANPHPNTGINKLRDAIRKAKPSIKTKFQQLTSSEEQRSSFVNHMLAAFVRLFDQLDALSASAEAEQGLEDTSAELAGLEEPTGGLEAPPPGTDIESELDIQLESILREIEVELEDDAEADDNDVVSADLEAEKEKDKQLSQVEKDVEKKKAKDSEREEFGAGIEGDSTGRNQAFDAFNLVQSYFSDNYLDLDSPEDKEMFKKWGLYNLKLLLDSYEDELNPGLSQPDIQNPM
tara:strand:+ start:1062 stop:1943 length:882 start_codon:yes stop_codon:yes gene_type:complete